MIKWIIGKSAVLFALLFVVHFHGMAQGVPGAVDNYSGSSGVWINPSSISTGFVHDDIGLASLSFMLDNDFAYLPSGSLWPSVRGLMAPGGSWALFDGLQSYKEYYYRYHSGEKPRNIYQSFDMDFPSLMKTFAGNHYMAFALKQREYVSATRVPWEIPVLITESLSYDTMHHIRYPSEGMRFAMMGWSEVDLSYATVLFDNGAMKMDAGVTAKLPLGLSGLALNADVFDYEICNRDELFFYHLDGSAGMSIPLAYDSSFRDPRQLEHLRGPFYKGWGWGGDVGLALTYKRNTMVRETPRSACDDTPTPYYWRLGMSLIDAGWIHFSHHLITGHLVGDSIDVDLDVFDRIETVHGAAYVFDSIVGNTVSAFDTAVPFAIGLPTAVSVQFDVNPYRDFYCNVTWIQPVSRWLYDYAVEREPMLSVTPRYETSFVGVSMPVTLYGYRYLTAGAFVRVGPLTLGTNDLLSLTGLGKTRSFSFLVSLRLKLDRGDCLFHPIIDACGDRYRHR